MATSGARTAVLRVAWRVVRAVEFLLVAALTIYYGFLNLPSAAAAASSALRVAASLTVQWYMFIAANAIVMVLLALFLRRDDDASSSSDAPLFSGLWPSDDVDAQAGYLPSQGPTLMLPSPGAPLMLPPPPPVATDTEAVEEDKEKPVFVDKKAVHVTTVRAQAPRRSMSEKTAAAAAAGGGGAIHRRREAAPELRRVESENGRQRQPEASPVELGTDDEEAFRRYIDAYISKQQARFQCEESAAAAAAAAAASGKGGGGGAVVAGAVVAVK